MIAQTAIPGFETMTKVAMKERKVPKRRIRLNSRPLVLKKMVLLKLTYSEFLNDVLSKVSNKIKCSENQSVPTGS